MYDIVYEISCFKKCLRKTEFGSKAILAKSGKSFEDQSQVGNNSYKRKEGGEESQENCQSSHIQQDDTSENDTGDEMEASQTESNDNASLSSNNNKAKQVDRVEVVAENKKKEKRQQPKADPKPRRREPPLTSLGDILRVEEDRKDLKRRKVMVYILKFFIRLFVMSFGFVIAIISPSFVKFISLIGSFVFSTLGFIFPVKFFFSLIYQKNY